MPVTATETTQATSDSDADGALTIQFRSNRRYRVDWELLKRHSEFFRSMPPPDSEVVGSSQKLIHLDCDGGSFFYVIGLISKRKFYEYSLWSELAAIVKFGEDYQFTHLPDLVLPWAWRLMSMNYPVGEEYDSEGRGDYEIALELWGIMVFASNNDFIDLVKLVIASLHRCPFKIYDVRNIYSSYLEELPIKYAIAFLKAMSKYPIEDVPDPETRWSKISRIFRVPHDDDDDDG